MKLNFIDAVVDLILSLVALVMILLNCDIYLSGIGMGISISIIISCSIKLVCMIHNKKEEERKVKEFWEEIKKSL